MRILHVTPYCDAAWAYGGIPRVVGALVRGLAKRGHRVTVCATDARDAISRLPPPPGVRRHRPWDLDVTPEGVAVRVFPNVSNRAAYRLQAFAPCGLRDYLNRHARTFDVAHLHAYRNSPGLFAATRLARVGVPYLVAPNGTVPVIERWRGLKRAFDALVGRSFLASATCVLAVTEAERRQLREAGVPNHAIRIVPNPIDLSEFAPPLERGLFRRDRGWTDTPIVLFLGQLTPRKHVDTLVAAFARATRPARLVIAGNDMGAGRRARELVADLNLTERTIFTGLLTGRERLEALADADVVVYASEHEVFGLVPLEALLTGTPVIVAGDSGCGEVIQSIGGGLIVEAGRVDALATAIDQVLEQPGDWRAVAARAALSVRSAFGEEVVCGRLEEVYADVISRVPATRPA